MPAGTTARTGGSPPRRLPAAAKKLLLKPDRATLNADGHDLSCVTVTVTVTDWTDRQVPRSNPKIPFEVTGPAEIIATGNGDATGFEPFQSKTHAAWNGPCLAILRSTGQPGKVVFKATAPGLMAAQVKSSSSRGRLQGWPRDGPGFASREAPEGDTSYPNPCYDPHAFCLCVGRRMPQEPPDEHRGAVVRNVQPDQGVAAMRQSRAEEVLIQAEEHWRRESVQYGNQILVLGSRNSHFNTDDAKPNPPFTQQLPLAGGQIFVEHRH